MEAVNLDVQTYENDPRTEELFNRGCAWQLRTKAWGARKKLPKEAVMDENLANDYSTASKYLIHPRHLKPIYSVRSKAWNYLKTMSVNINIDGVVFVPMAFFSTVDQSLQNFHDLYFELVDDLVLNYEYCINEAREYLGPWFNIYQYPYDIRSRFSFQWTPFAFTPPKEGIQQLDPQMIRRTEQRFKNMMDDFCANATVSLREEFMNLLSGLVTRMDVPDAKGFVSSNITKLTTFIDKFRHLSITNDSDLERLVEETKSLISGVSGEDVRTNDSFRLAIANEMKKVQDQMYPLLQKKVRKLAI